MENEKVRITYYLPRYMTEKVKTASKTTMIPQSRLVEVALREWIEKGDAETERRKAIP